MPTLQEIMHLQNMFGAPNIGASLPESGPAGLSTPPLVDPSKDPFSNISFGDTNFKPMPTAVPSSQTAPGDMGFDAAERMKQIYQPETQATDKFNQLINRYPQRSNYEPSMMRRIAASLAMFGRGGPELANKVFEAPFSDALTDWKNQVQPAGEAAQFERYQNTNSRMAAYQQVAAELKQHAQDAKDKNDDRNAQIREHRAAVYEFKAHNPGMKFSYPKGGNVMAADPITGQLHDTGVPTGSMTELDKMNLGQDNALERIGATGAEARKTENVKETNRESLQNIKGWTLGEIQDPDDPTKKISVRMNADTGEIKRATLEGQQVRGAAKLGTPKGSSGKDETPTQTRVRQFNAARQMFNTRADLKKFIKLGNPGSNDFTVTPPSDGFFGHSGPTPEQYKEIHDTIYGAATGTPISSHSNAPATAPMQAPKAPAGFKYVPKPGGGWTAQPDPTNKG